MTQKRCKILLALALLILLLALVLFLWRTGVFTRLGDAQALADYLTAQAPWSHLAFFALQFCSVIIAPIPSNLVAGTGGAVFGVWQAFLLTLPAVVLGSCTTFWLARTLCRDWASRLVQRKLPKRYQTLIREKRDWFLFLTFLFPCFPDDLLCILAGVTEIPFRRFLLLVLLARPWGLLAAGILGGSLSDSAARIPILLLCFALAVLLFLFGERWKEGVIRLLSRKT